MFNYYNGCAEIALYETHSLNLLEDSIAQEWYGCSYDELGEDERCEVTYEALDRFGN